MSTILKKMEIQPYLDALQNSKSQFKSYWDLHKQEIEQFENRLLWRIDSTKSPSSRHTQNGYMISLKNFPITLEDAHIVSHEMEHCRLWEMGYPNIQPQFTFDKLDLSSRGRQCAALSNMIYNPMIECHLNEFYNSCHAIKSIYENKFTEWINVRILNNQDLFCYSCYYLTGIITIKWLCGEINNINTLNEFQKKRQNDIIPCSEKIYSVLERSQYICHGEKSIDFIQDLVNVLKIEFNIKCFNRPK